MTAINYTTFYIDMLTNVTLSNIAETSSDLDAMRILQIIISSVGTIANFIVVFVFVNHKQLRIKIANMFIINQISCSSLAFSHPKDGEGNVFNLSISGGGYPDQVRKGEVARLGIGTSLPGTGQHMEYLIRGGRYTS